MTEPSKPSAPFAVPPADAPPHGQPVIFDWIRQAHRDLAMQGANVVFPTQGPCGGLNRRDAYSCEVHARLCQCKLLGMSDRAAAKTIGLHPKTVTQLRRRYPKLNADMDSAAELANAHAALLLRGLMEGGGPTAFQAVKFFLSTHSPEFKEVQHVDVQVDVGQTIRRIRTGLYGLPDQPGEGSASPDSPDAEPVAGCLPAEGGEAAVPAEVPADVSTPPAAPCGAMSKAVAAAEAAAAEDIKASGVAGPSPQPAAADWLNEL